MVPEGGSAKLVCKARGHPKPKVVWRREDGGDIIVRGGTSAKSRSMSFLSIFRYFPHTRENDFKLKKIFQCLPSKVKC